MKNKLIGTLSTLWSLPKVLWLKVRGARVPLFGRVRIFGCIKTAQTYLLEIAPRTTFGRFVRLEGAVKIGQEVFINEFTTLAASESAPITIGEKTSIAQYCFLISGDHDISAGVAVNVEKADQGGRQGAITIGKNCWLGAHSVVLKGVTIGDGAVIGAGSVVTSDIPANSVAVGNPARVIKTRS